jgi:hypothetical protein
MTELNAAVSTSGIEDYQESEVDRSPASRSALGGAVEKNGDSGISYCQLGHCGTDEQEPGAKPMTVQVSTPALSLEKRRSYADTLSGKPSGSLKSDMKAAEISQESLAGGDAAHETGQGMFSMMIKSAINFLRPVSSGPGEDQRGCFEVIWNVLIRPEIIREGWKLQMCLEFRSVERMVPLSSAACEKGDRIQKAAGTFNVPMNESIRYSFFIAKGSEKKRLQEGKRLVSIPSADSRQAATAALTPEILDDINIFKKPQLGLQDLFTYRLNQFLENITASRFGMGPSIAFAISRLDLMLSVKITGGGASSGSEDRFGPPRGATRMEIRRVVAEWCAAAVIDSHDKEQKTEACIFCSAILGYFSVSSDEIFKSLKWTLAYQCLEGALGSKVHTERCVLTLDARSRDLALAGVVLLCNTMVQSKSYGWMALLYLLNLETEDHVKMFSNVQESSFAAVRQDTTNFADALRRSGLTRGGKGAGLALKHVPSISALLKDPNVTALFSSNEIAARLALFIPRANNRTHLSRDLQSIISEWLISVASSADMQVFGSSEAQSFNILLSTIFGAQLALDGKIDYMFHISCILAKASRASTGQDFKDLLEDTLLIICKFVSQLPKAVSYRARTDKNDILRSVWNQVFKVEAMFDEAVAHPPLSSSLGQICRTWLYDVDDKEFVQLFAFILDKEKDRNGVQNPKLSTRLRRCCVHIIYCRRFCIKSK